MLLLACWNGRKIRIRHGFEFSGAAWAFGFLTDLVMRLALGVEWSCCHFSSVLALQNAMRELVSGSIAFRVPEGTAYQLCFAIDMHSAEPGLRF